jgi:hypothetical protein
MSMAKRFWTGEEQLCLRLAYPHYPTEAIARHLGRDVKSVYVKAKNLGLRKTAAFLASEASGRLTSLSAAGINHRFKAGQRPWNAGKKGWQAGGRSVATRFRKGNRPHTWQPIGSYRLTKDGYLQRKVTDTGYPPRDWRSMHSLVWEAAHGPIPDGHVVVFRPGRMTTDPEQITVAGLELVSRAELMHRNSYHTRLPKELARIVQLRGAIQRQINKRQGKRA